MESPGAEFEYVVVGSGAGGGPLAAHLAEAGHTVLLLEAGGDDEGLAYQVPAFHGAACEDESMCWNFFVKHYEAPERRRADSKLTEEKDGVLYPRAGTLGGCTAHNAMITVYPHDRDWDEIARLTGDPSWNAATMRGYFERLERCTHAERHGSLREQITGRARSLAGRLGLAPAEAGDAGDSGHGFDGWLTTSVPDPALAIKDPQLLKIIVGVAEQVLIEGIGRPLSRFKGRFDPNDKRVAAKSPEGLAVTPLAIDQGRRAGPRDLIRRVQAQYPGRLVVRTHALASRVLLDDTRRAVGVEYLEGEHLYRADPRAASATPTPPVRQVLASREVILCGGAFNTPQLLMLSGIGPATELNRHKIPVRVDLPGVGRNLQDRYEIGVIAEMASDFKILEGGTFLPPEPNSPPDPALRDWEEGKGLYATNGVVISVVKRSRSTRPDPDLYIFGLPGFFRGYYPGFAKRTEGARNCFTWAILKAHTRNTAGFITLRSADPRDVPEINFKYFDEGNDAAGEDLDSVVEGVRFARRLMKQFGPAFKRELIPGPEVPDEKVPDFIKREAWGHHASCSCKMGPSSDEMAVVDSEFRVHGTRNLRVVDASVFPRIPGFFIVSAVYMISEKAADVILAAAAAAGGEGPAAKVWPVPAPPPVFLGGTRQAEAQRMAAAGRELLQLQHELRAVNADRRPGRAFHRMGIAFRATYTPLTAGLLDARWVPPEIRTALFDPGLRVKDGFARLSYGRGDDNLNGLMPDVRGLWLRLATVNGVQDLTATNAEVPFFDDPEELLAFGFATRQLVQNTRAHPLLTPATLLQYEPQLAAQLMRLKPAEFASKLAAHRRAAAMLAGVTAPGLPVHSLAQTQFWSGAPLYLRGTDGRTYAFKFTFTPDPSQGRRGLPTKDLFSELTRHPRVHYELRTQLYVDDQSTPIERPAKWHVPESKIGDVYVETGGAPISDLVDGEASNPATNLDGISPAGLNRLRADLYAISARGRSGCPFSGGKLYGRS